MKKKNSFLDKLIIGIIVIIIILIPITIGVVIFEKSTFEEFKNTQPVHVRQEITTTIIPVKVTKIKDTWRKFNLIKWNVSVKSEEYNLEDTFEEYLASASASAYGLDLYYRKLKEGDIIKVELKTWKTGKVIDKQKLTKLVR